MKGLIMIEIFVGFIVLLLLPDEKPKQKKWRQKKEDCQVIFFEEILKDKNDLENY